jgi:hypothetical protein
VPSLGTVSASGRQFGVVQSGNGAKHLAAVPEQDPQPVEVFVA